MRNITPLVVLILCVACAPSNGNDPEIDSIESQLFEIAAMSSRDQSTAAMTSEYMNYFAAEPILLPEGMPAIQGKEQVAAFYNNAFGGIKILSNKYEDPKVVVSGQRATRHYVGTAVFNIEGENDPVTARNRYIDVLVQEDGEWKMLVHSWVAEPGE